MKDKSCAAAVETRAKSPYITAAIYLPCTSRAGQCSGALLAPVPPVVFARVSLRAVGLDSGRLIARAIRREESLRFSRTTRVSFLSLSSRKFGYCNFLSNLVGRNTIRHIFTRLSVISYLHLFARRAACPRQMEKSFIHIQRCRQTSPWITLFASRVGKCVLTLKRSQPVQPGAKMAAVKVEG